MKNQDWIPNLIIRKSFASLVFGKSIESYKELYAFKYTEADPITNWVWPTAELPSQAEP
jgi:hypothetical protein